jgi:hypothetical protein
MTIRKGRVGASSRDSGDETVLGDIMPSSSV